MRVIVAGLGVQGEKRKRIAGENCIATVDPDRDGVDFKTIEDVPLDSFDAALVCVPDTPKPDILSYLLSNGKHVLVEKPLINIADGDLTEIKRLATENNAICYTAYNHRFEPHFVRMRNLLQTGELGEIYTVRLFYGNGTARLVRNSAWRDEGPGVLPDLGSHLLDTLLFWFGEELFSNAFEITSARRFENRSFDHVTAIGRGKITVQMEMTLLMWRNHFTCDILAENGSAHIESLCKWGPTTFSHRTRVLPSGKPPEDTETLVQADPTWQLEYDDFLQRCSSGVGTNIDNDQLIEKHLTSMAAQAMELTL
jgi:scyllo-inositol 2-dehydrogenase (NADP+)